MSINSSEYLKKIMTLEDYTKYLNAIDFEDFGKIEKILKKYKFKMVIKQSRATCNQYEHQAQCNQRLKYISISIWQGTGDKAQAKNSTKKAQATSTGDKI